MSDSTSVLIGQQISFAPFCSRQGVADDNCQPDPTGRQINVRSTMYPSDVENELKQKSAFEICSSTFHGDVTIVVWTLFFKYDLNTLIALTIKCSYRLMKTQNNSMI